MTIDDVLRVLNVLAAGVAAGVLVTVLTSQIPTVRALGPRVGHELKALYDPPIDRLVPPALIGSLILAVIILIVADRLSGVAAALSAVGIAGTVGTAALSVRLSLPLEKAMHELSGEQAADGFTPLFERWAKIHVARTALCAGAFAAYVAALLAGPGQSWGGADVVRLIGITAAGLAAGVQVAGAVAQIQAIRGLLARTALAVKQQLDRCIDRVEPPLVFGSIVAGVLVLAFASHLSGAAKAWTIAGIACSAGLAGISVAVNMPLNRRMRGWAAEGDVPPEFSAAHDRWAVAHRVRTVAALAAVVCYAAAGIAGVY